MDISEYFYGQMKIMALKCDTSVFLLDCSKGPGTSKFTRENHAELIYRGKLQYVIVIAHVAQSCVVPYCPLAEKPETNGVSPREQQQHVFDEIIKMMQKSCNRSSHLEGLKTLLLFPTAYIFCKHLPLVIFCTY